MTNNFDAIIIGAGQAGPPLAARLSEAGQTVALIERKLFGGTCVNTGCIPTKTLIASAHTAHLARRAQDFGVHAGPVTVDMKAVKARKDAISGQSRTSVEKSLADLDRCTVFRGQARFESPTSIRVGPPSDPRGDQVLLSAPKIFVNVGGRATVPDLPGVHDVPLLTNSTILDLDILPQHLVIVGGSYIGIEFAQMYRRFGAEVTLVEKGPRILAKEDEDTSAAIQQILEKEGIAVRTRSECIHFKPSGEEISVGANCAAGSPDLLASHVLLAVGRRPNTGDLGLDQAGVTLDKKGYIQVDDQLQTNVPGIWAMGDCNGRGAFTHTSYNDFEIVAANLLDNDPRRLSDRITAYNIYLDPPLGRVGLTETEVRASGRPALIATRPMSKVGRAVEKGETAGFMKVLVDAETKMILGAAILGNSGDEAIHTFLDIMYSKAPYTTLQRAVHIHPTVSELIPTLLGDLKPLEGISA